MGGAERGPDMKKHTKWLAALFAAICVLGMAACRSETATTAGTTSDATTVDPKDEHTHSFGEWTVKKAATCTEKGSKERVCACGETETEEIAALGHGSTELRNVRAASCTESGYSGDTYCSVCGEKLESGKEVAATGHSFGEWTVKTAPTCTEDGEQERVCACGESETQTIPATWEVTLSVEVTYHDGVLLAKIIVSGCAGIENGKVTIGYDADAFALTSVELGLDCVYDINTKTAGQLSIAWVASATEETQVLATLALTPAEGATELHIDAQLDEAFFGGHALKAQPVTATFDCTAVSVQSLDEGGKKQ